MGEPLFICNQCKDNKEYTSVEASKHKQETGHNSFRMIKSEEKKEG